eukprot:14888138-Heterocapsa_arctica.AAC.1
MHRRAKTIKNILEKYENDKRDDDNNDIIQIVSEATDERNSNVNKHINNFQSRIDETNERDKNI